MNVVILWLINENGEILLSKRAPSLTTDAGVWGPSVSGMIEAGETPSQAAIREASEELGINPLDLPTLNHMHDLHHNHEDGQSREFFSYYSITRSSLSKKFKLEPSEVTATKWIKLDRLIEEYKTNPESIIISSNSMLWNNIFVELENVINYN